jgi:beta-aspartyl-peptidase (threonine type)
VIAGVLLAQETGNGARESRVVSHAMDRAKITEALTAQQQAWNRGDLAAFLKGYWESPELTFSGSSGIARGIAGVRERYQRNYPDRATMGELTFSDFEFRFLGPQAALVLGKWHLKRESKADVGGVFSLVWQRFPDGWKIVHDHTSTVEGM